MITTAAVDTPAELFAGAPVAGDHPAMASGVAFGQVLSASADIPVAPIPPLISRTMPGITALPIGTLMGTGSLPFQAPSLPSALAWPGVSVPVSTGGTMPPASQPRAILSSTVASMPITSAPLPAVAMTDGSLAAVPLVIVEAERRMPVIDRSSPMTAAPFTMVSMPIKSAPLSAAVVMDGSLTAAPPAIEPAGQPMPVVDGPSLTVVKEAPEAAIPVRTPPVVEAPLAEIVTLDLPALAPAEAETANPTLTTDGSRVLPPPASVGKVERQTVAPARLTGSPVSPSSDDLTAPPADPEPVVSNETATPVDRKGSVKRAEAKEKAPEALIANSLDPLAMPSPAPLPAAMLFVSSGKPVTTPGSDAPVSSDEDRPDSADRNRVEGAPSPGAIPLPAEMAVAPIKTATMAAEKPAAAGTPSVHPAIVSPPQTDAASLAAIDTGKTAAPNVATSMPHIGNAVREEGRVTETGSTKTEPASFANLVIHTETTAAPASTTPTPPPEPRVTAEPGRMGQEMGVVIARHAATGGGEAMTVRLDPVEFGRIEVTLSFDDSGTIRAVVAAESPAALDLLRRDSADLGRSLAEAGIRSDAQSFRFDTRQGSADGSGQGGQRWQQQPATGTRAAAQPADDIPEPRYRPLRTSGRVDLMA